MKLLILFIAFVLTTHSLVCKAQIRTLQPVGNIKTQLTQGDEIASVKTQMETDLVIYRPGV